MSAGKTFGNTLLQLTWGAPMTSAALYFYLPLDLVWDLVVNVVVGIKTAAGSPTRENWFSNWQFRDSYFGMHSSRQSIAALSFNGLLPKLFGARRGAMTLGQVVWTRKSDLAFTALPRMLEVWDIDGAPGLDAFDQTAFVESAVAIVATTGGKTRLHATSWGRGFGNSATGSAFTDKKLPGDTFARGMIHLAESLPEGFPTGGGSTPMRVDEYTVTGSAKRAVAAIETSLAFILKKGKVAPGQFLYVSAPKADSKPAPVAARIRDVTTESYEGFYHLVDLDTVALEVELPQTFAGGKLRVQRLNDVAGTARSGDWQGGPAELTKAEAETLPEVAESDVLRIEAGGGEITVTTVDAIEMKLQLAPPLLEAAEEASVNLLRADASFTATLTDFTEPARLTLAAGHPPVAVNDLLLIRLGDEKKHAVVTAVAGETITIFPALDFANLELHVGTPVNVQRWVPITDRESASFKSAAGDVLTVRPPRASVFRKGSMVSFVAGGKRAFREVEKITEIKIVLKAPAAGTAPFIIELAQFDTSLDETGVDVVTRHRRLRWISGEKPSAYGTYPQSLLAVRPRLRTAVPSIQSDGVFFTNGLPNPDPAHHRTWKPLTEGANEFWLLGGDLPVEADGSDTLWRFNPHITRKFEGAVEADIIEYTKGKASRVDGTPAGARISVHAPEVQVPEEPAVTDNHERAIIEHELRHVKQFAHWGPIMFCLPVPGVAKLIATLAVAAGDDPPQWARRLLEHPQGELADIEYASLGGLLEAFWNLFIPADVDTEVWQTIFSPVTGLLLNLIPDLDPEAGGGEKFGVATLQILGHALDLRSWTPGLGLYPWLTLVGDHSFIEQQASRASGEMYSATLSADDKFNADYKTYFIPHEKRDADGERTLGSATRMMAWTENSPLLSIERGNGPGSQLVLSFPGSLGGSENILSFIADAEIVVAGDLYSATGTTLTLEGPASLTRAQSDFHVVAAGGKVIPRPRAFVPTPPRVNHSTGYYFIPTAPAAYTLKVDGFTEDQAGTNVVKLNVTAGNVTLGRATVPWARPAAVGAPLDTLPVLQIPEGSSRLLSAGGTTTGFTADLDSTAQFNLRGEAQGWRISAPAAFAAGVKARVRLYRVFQPDDPAFDLTYQNVPTLAGVRSLLVAPVWIPVRDFVVELVRAMKAEVVLNGNTSPASHYIGWSPRPATLRLTENGGATGNVNITLRNPATSVGKVTFGPGANGPFSDTMQLSVNPDGSTAPFFVRGRFGSPSVNDKDAVIEAVNEDGDVVSRTELMVRVRKNANNLTAGERDRLIEALARVNNAGAGVFAELRAIHTSIADDEAHSRDGFLPWHRAYVLDLERELQREIPSVTIPYWRFDQPAPNLFTQDFLGEPNGPGSVRFSATNPLQNWTTDGVLGLQRTPRFNHLTEQAGNLAGPTLSQADTLALSNSFAGFRAPMEGNPHGRAHTSWDGPINSVPTAPRDPLFFMLHANVDRLWSIWQKNNNRYDVTSTSTYPFLGRAGDPGSERIGHNLLDTMWPWNGDTAAPRPSSAPGGALAASPVTSAPPAVPTVRDMIDYHGRNALSQWQGFDYDDVDF